MDNNLRGVPVEGFADKSREAAVEGTLNTQQIFWTDLKTATLTLTRL